MVARTTTNAKGVHATNKHKSYVAEGQDIKASVVDAPIEFKDTVTVSTYSQGAAVHVLLYVLYG